MLKIGLLKNQLWESKMKSSKFFAIIAILSLVFPTPYSFAQAEALSVAPKAGGLPMGGSQMIPADRQGDAQTASLHDHRAKVFDFSGDVKILKKGSDNWIAVTKEMVLEMGDQLLTKKESTLDIAYDEYFLNIVRVDENTKAEFRSIEPTDLHLEEGTLFNALDGLAGEKYQISTQTAVAGVRGTQLSAIVVDGLSKFGTNEQFDIENHLVEVKLNGQETSIMLKEGEQVSLIPNQLPAVGPIDSSIASAFSSIAETMQPMQSLQEQGLAIIGETENANPILLEDQKNIGSNDGGDNGLNGNGPADSNSNNGNLLAKIEAAVDTSLDALLTPMDVPVEQITNVETSTKSENKNESEDEENNEPGSSASSTSNVTLTSKRGDDGRNMPMVRGVAPIGNHTTPGMAPTGTYVAPGSAPAARPDDMAVARFVSLGILDSKGAVAPTAGNAETYAAGVASNVYNQFSGSTGYDPARATAASGWIGSMYNAPAYTANTAPTTGMYGSVTAANTAYVGAAPTYASPTTAPAVPGSMYGGTAPTGATAYSPAYAASTPAPYMSPTSTYTGATPYSPYVAGGAYTATTYNATGYNPAPVYTSPTPYTGVAAYTSPTPGGYMPTNYAPAPMPGGGYYDGGATAYTAPTSGMMAPAYNTYDAGGTYTAGGYTSPTYAYAPAPTYDASYAPAPYVDPNTMYAYVPPPTYIDPNIAQTAAYTYTPPPPYVDPNTTCGTPEKPC
jgi:hypothetical protein